MSRLLARIMFAIFLLPSAALLYLICYALVDEIRLFEWPYRRRGSFIITAAIVWAFIAVYWILLWKKSLRWTIFRKRMTLFAFAGAACAGGVAGVLVRWIDRDLGFFVFSWVTPLAWLPLTLFIWRESPSERAERLSSSTSAVVCPGCGYNLTGLNVARCPECGSTFTLDELMSRQPNREIAELVR